MLLAFREIYLSAYGKKSSWIFLIMLTFFWVLSFIRWETGTDWDAYVNYFNYNYTLSDFLAKHEFGYAFINFIVKDYIGSYTFLLGLLGLIIYFCIGNTIYKLSKYPYISLLTWFSGFTFGYILFVRQHVAIAILFYSIRYITKRDLKKFLICLLLAVSFHASSIIFIFSYLIYPLKFKIKHYIIIVGIGLIVGLTFNEFVLSYFADIFGGYTGTKLLKYVDLGQSETFGTTMSMTQRLISGIISRGFFIILTLIVFRKSRLTNPQVNGYLNIYIIGLIVFLIFIPISIVFSRFADYFDIILILLIPSIVGNLKSTIKRTFLLILLSIYMFKWLITLCVSDYKIYYIPYRTIFQHQTFIN